jgi:CRP/FNR family transcriptional regulator
MQPPVSCGTCEVRGRSVFCSLESPGIGKLDTMRESSLYKKGQLLFQDGGFPQGLYCMFSGKAKLYQLEENGRQQILRLATAGDVLGYRALLSDEKYTSCCEIIEDSWICFIPRQAFLQLASSEPGLFMKMIRLLSNDLKRAEQRITGIVYHNVRMRTAETLMFLAEIYGFEPDRETLNVVLSREELANIAGTATETVIRALAELKEEGLISYSGKKIRIPDMSRLQRSILPLSST